MTDTTMLRSLEAGAIDGGSREGCDRASILRLGQLFVLAVGVALVLVVATTLYDLVAGLLADATALGGPSS